MEERNWLWNHTLKAAVQVCRTYYKVLKCNFIMWFELHFICIEQEQRLSEPPISVIAEKWKYSTQARTAQKMKFSIKDFFSKCDQIRILLRIWSHLLKKALMENFNFCAVSMKIGAENLSSVSNRLYYLFSPFLSPWA